MTDATKIPRIGVGVFILNDKNEFVFGQRKGSHGQGTWALPGGHLEIHESFEECARREVLEETGLEIGNIHFLTATNSPRIDGTKHYVTVFVVAKIIGTETRPQLLEPGKCEGWYWTSWDTMLEWYEENKSSAGSGGTTGGAHDLFLPMIDLVEQRPDLKPTQNVSRMDVRS